MKHLRNIPLLALLFTSAVFGQQIEVREIRHNRVELTLTAKNVLDAATAQLLLRPRAEQECGDKDPIFGHYHFEGHQPLEPGSSTEESSTFRFVQEITCGSARAVRSTGSKVGIRQDNLSTEVEAFIQSISLQFLKARSTGAFKEAYAALSSKMRSLYEFGSWTKKAKEFNEGSGTMTSATVWQVTVYEDPPGAPMPGTYIAADYEVAYENIALRCGYLMWYELPEHRYVIVREESGILPAEVLAKVSDEQLPRVKAKLGCAR